MVALFLFCTVTSSFISMCLNHFFNFEHCIIFDWRFCGYLVHWAVDKQGNRTVKQQGNKSSSTTEQPNSKARSKYYFVGLSVSYCIKELTLCVVQALFPDYVARCGLAMAMSLEAIFHVLCAETAALVLIGLATAGLFCTLYTLLFLGSWWVLSQGQLTHGSMWRISEKVASGQILDSSSNIHWTY